MSPGDIAEAHATLGPEAARLFDSMSRADQWHALRVYRRIRDAGHGDQDLLRAALLHDVGKSGTRLSIWHRVAIDLAGTFWPRALVILERSGPAGLRRAVGVSRDHAALGAREAERSGLPPRVVRLIAGDPDPALAPQLCVLREHDSKE